MADSNTTPEDELDRALAERLFGRTQDAESRDYDDEEIVPDQKEEEE